MAITQGTPRSNHHQPAVNDAYVNCARDAASENAARIELMGALASIEQTMARLERAARSSVSVAEALGEHYRALEGIRADFERQLKS